MNVNVTETLISEKLKKVKKEKKTKGDQVQTGTRLTESTLVVG